MADKIRMTDEAWRERLTPEQYEVVRRKGTEPPFTGRWYENDVAGVYRCVACGSELFSSKTKYHSGSGWPSFWAPEASDRVRTERDESHGMIRTEALCARCDAHLGHVFPDGPEPTGLRFCINSVSLDFEPRSEARPSAPESDRSGG